MKIRDFVLVGLGQAVAGGGGFLVLKLQGVWLQPEQFGHLVLAINLAGFMQGALVAGHSNAATRYAGEAVAAHEGYWLIRSLLGCMLRRMRWIAPVMALIGMWVCSTGQVAPSLLLLAALLSLVQAASGVADGWTLSHGRQSLFFLMVLCGTLLRLGLACAGVLLARQWGCSLEAGFLAGFVVAWTLLASGQWLVQRRDWQGSRAPDGKRWNGEVSTFSAPFLLWSLAGWVQTAMDRWSLTWWCGHREVGVFGAASQLCGPPMALGAAVVTNYAAPRLVQSARSSAAGTSILARWRLLAWAGLAALAMAALVMAVLADRLVVLLLSDNYLAAAPLLPWLVVSAGSAALAQMLTTPFQVLEPRIVHRMKLAIPLGGAVAALAGAWLWGLPGVIGAGLVTNGSFLVWAIVALHLPGNETRMQASRGVSGGT